MVEYYNAVVERVAQWVGLSTWYAYLTIQKAKITAMGAWLDKGKSLIRVNQK
jgi:hypothetical protein